MKITVEDFHLINNYLNEMDYFNFGANDGEYHYISEILEI